MILISTIFLLFIISIFVATQWLTSGSERKGKDSKICYICKNISDLIVMAFDNMAELVFHRRVGNALLHLIE